MHWWTLLQNFLATFHNSNTYGHALVGPEHNIFSLIFEIKTIVFDMRRWDLNTIFLALFHNINTYRHVLVGA